ncbi:MAG: hypothetical protein JWM47_2145, partial [Acidimicrobiales bacterium]|nr:hypothetical protein [Acidimicrobiales bacterium]
MSGRLEDSRRALGAVLRHRSLLRVDLAFGMAC